MVGELIYPLIVSPGGGLLEKIIAIVGYYGPKTAEAVKRFQMIHGLSPDGIYGSKNKVKFEALL